MKNHTSDHVYVSVPRNTVLVSARSKKHELEQQYEDWIETLRSEREADKYLEKLRNPDPDWIARSLGRIFRLFGRNNASDVVTGESAKKEVEGIDFDKLSGRNKNAAVIKVLYASDRIGWNEGLLLSAEVVRDFHNPIAELNRIIKLASDTKLNTISLDLHTVEYLRLIDKGLI